MYEAYLEVKINKEHLPKLERILRERWKVKKPVFEESKRGWIISFLTTDNRKVYAFKDVVKNYGGKILDLWIFPLPKGSD